MWLTEHVPFDSLRVEKTETSADGTALKWLLATHEHKHIETVLLLHSAEKNKIKWGTVCVSSQIGCPMRCRFCATGQMKFVRNLTTNEILDQFLIAKREAHARGVTDLNVVFMGMGEPLLNLANVFPAIEILTNPKRFGLSPARLTLSTSGITPELRELLASKFKINLAFSLHAPNDALRSALMPVNQTYPLTEILAELRRFEARGTEVLYEYVLIAGVNDDEKCARELATLLRGRNAKINLIPLNPIPNSELKRPSGNQMHTFKKILVDSGLRATLRHTKGDDIRAACGQLKSKI